MWLTAVSIKRPLFISMVILALLIMGGVAYTRLGADLYPSVNLPYVSVLVVYPGAGPEEVESKITKPVEDAVAGLNNVKTIMSFSQESLSIISLEFQDGTDSNFAAVDVERKLNTIRSSLPPEAKAPSVVRAEFSALPVMNLVLTGKRSTDQLFRLADEKIRTRLETVKGVAAVQVVGGREREIQVRVDQNRLRAYGLSMQQIGGALAQANLSLPAGKLAEGGQEFTVRYDSLYRTVEDLRDLIIFAAPNGIVYLRDVAEVEDGFKRQTVITRYNGEESVGLIVTKQADANTIQVVGDMRKVIASVERTLPADVVLVVASDQAGYVRRSLDDIQTRLGEAVILTGIVLLLFLHTFRSTAIVLFSIPTSLISTFLVMWVLGFGLNMMSMIALALTVGILVDDSIVVLENIVRHLRLGQTPWTAALEGRREIGLAAIAITLVDVVVYTPVAFMSGIVGQFFRQFGLTITAATLFSLFVSFTLTPMLASRWLRPEAEANGRRSAMARFGERWEAGYNRLAQGYGRLLGWALAHRWAVVALGGAVFVAALAPLPLRLIGFEFMPAEDQGAFSATLEMPAGTALEATNRATQELEPKLKQIPEVRSYFTTVGRSGSGFSNTEEARYAMIDVKLVDKGERGKSAGAIALQVEALGRDIVGAKVRTQLPSMVVGSRQPFMMQIRGEDPATLKQLAAQLADVVRGIPGTSNITNSAAVGAPELLVRADPRRLADLGLTSAQVATALRASVEGSVVTALESESKKKVDIRVLGGDEDRAHVAGLANLPVQTGRGTTVQLDQVSDVRVGDGPAQIERVDRQRSVTIGANLVGRPLGEVARDFRTALDRMGLPPGYSVDIVGEAQVMDESFANLFFALILSVLLMYMLMVALYESLLYPLIIMFSLPLSIAGAFGGLLVTGKTVSMVSMIGLIMLMGLVGKNAILLVDYTNTLRRRGMDRLPALLEAGPTRLRPILMTTAAMVLAMMPLAVATGEGSETSSPLATVVIGGLVSSTLLTLVLVPVVYTLFDDVQGRLLRRKAAAIETAGLAPAGAVEG